MSTSDAPFATLLAHDGVEERCELRSTFGFMAFHGGSLEEVTDDVAESAATAAGASVYVVRQPPDLRWHLPSARIGAEGSPALRTFLDHVDVAVAVHGFGREGHWTSLLLGGANRQLASHLSSHLAPALPDYRIVDDLDDIPAPLRGLHRSNPVNLARGGGVQLELPPRVRGMGPFWDGHEARPVPHTRALVTALAAAAETWPR